MKTDESTGQKSPTAAPQTAPAKGNGASTATHTSTVPEEALARFLSFSHNDPHSVLGAHPGPGGVTVRVFRPDAESVTLMPESGTPATLRKAHPAGLFEVTVPGTEIFRYRYEVKYPGGKSYTLRDPYAWLPYLGELDLHLFSEGRHERLWEKLGAHAIERDGVPGTAFAVWAPAARGVSVVGNFNGWDGRLHPMRSLGASGVWELFVPDVGPGALYKFEVRSANGTIHVKADPYAQRTETPPGTASIVLKSEYRWSDTKWIEARKKSDPLKRPLSVYEVHLGSWRRIPEQGNRSLTYRELAEPLTSYVKEHGFTHVELLPVTEHPYGPSWGYQVTGYFAPTARWGTPDDLKFLIDTLHQNGIGVIADWVPAHFPKDVWALGRFTGEALYEHLDPKLGEHPDWGTYIFNFGRHEVKNFLLASALYWLDEYHLDGLRVDAVASMLYLDYSRKAGEWVPNKYGGRENLEAIEFLKEMNAVAHAKFPGVLMIAEESTAWGGVSRPTYAGGLGFTYKWNMGWMHDTLLYFSKEPIHRKYHHNNLTFGLLYAWTENFILPLSHDEVVHGKGSLLSKMPGDRWQKFANLRSLYGYMWAHPGKKMLFMGSEIGQWNEWSEKESLSWEVLLGQEHSGLQRLVADLNRVYRDEPALWESDHEAAGFEWIDANDADSNVIVFRRISPSTGRQIVCACNFSPVPREEYRVGLPRGGTWEEILNTDAGSYGGGNVGNQGSVIAEGAPWHGRPFSALVTLPPLGVVWFRAPK